MKSKQQSSEIAEEIRQGEHSNSGVLEIFEAARDHLELFTYLDYADLHPDSQGKPIVYNTVRNRRLIKTTVAGLKLVSNLKPGEGEGTRG